ATFAQANHIDHVFRFELIRENAIARLQIAVAAIEPEFALELHTLGAGLLQVPGIGLIRLLCILDQTELNGVITIRGRRLTLRNDARASLDKRHRDNLAIRIKHLRHADLFAENSWTHFASYLRLAENRGLVSLLPFGSLTNSRPHPANLTISSQML